jgi:RNA polymerase sigma-70 factor (ECF subfamily)
MKPYNENEIVKQLQNASQQREAFGLIVQHFSQQLYWQIRRMVVAHDDANDILQNTFIKAWMNLETFRGEAKLSTWLYRIALNETLSFLQKSKLTISLDEEDASPITQLHSDTYFDGDETQILLQQAIATLPEKQRIVFNLKYYKEMKYEEMSKILHTSVGALKTSYHIAVKKVADFFHEHD